MENNGGCKLPCWWGITPGKSNWEETRAFFEKFSMLIYEEKDVKVIRNDSEVELDYHGIEYKLSSSYENSYIIIWTQNDIVDSISVNKIEGSTGFFVLSDVVKHFGNPDRIWINARETSKEKWMVAYDFVYDKQKFVIRYFSFDGQEEDGMITACFQEASGLELFSENEILSRDTIYQQQLIKIIELDLAEFSESRLQEFISSVENSDEEFCIQTLLRFWE
ncbi:MAG: hypothetical protein D8M60_20900 [Chloroflexi bacterium]|nr:hypothetical protein [Chloroflexota bacterium]